MHDGAAVSRSIFPTDEGAIVHRHEDRESDRAFASYDIVYEEEAMIEPDPLSVVPYEPPPWAFNRTLSMASGVVRDVRRAISAGATEAEVDAAVAEMNAKVKR